MKLFSVPGVLAILILMSSPAAADTIVVVVPTATDDRLPATREAIEFRNVILTDLQLETRIELRDVVINAPFQRQLEIYARQVSQRGARLPAGVVEPDSPEELRELDPDFERLGSLPVLGFIVTARSDIPEYDFLSRFFAPATGVQEDPVTGSAHCALAPYWAEKLGKTEMVGFQASLRGGVVKVKYGGDRVKLFGQAVTVLRGELT